VLSGLESQIHLLATDLREEDGAFMEPSGRNQWQPVASAPSLKAQKQPKTVAVGCDQLPEGPHGKEERCAR
jgi:hypothetical protein